MTMHLETLMKSWVSNAVLKIKGMHPAHTPNLQPIIN